jgi:hypothetical protein
MVAGSMAEAVDSTVEAVVMAEWDGNQKLQLELQGAGDSAFFVSSKERVYCLSYDGDDLHAARREPRFT